MADSGEVPREVPAENTNSESDEEVDLAKCASEFSQYCQVDVMKESKAIEDSIEDMLIRLDEFSHLADTIRNDSSQALMEAIPELHNRSQELPVIFRKIDQLEVFVNAVKKSVDDFEEAVNTAEKELGSYGIKKVLSSIPGLRQMRQGASKKEKDFTEWEPPAVFKTSDFFGETSTEELSAVDQQQDSDKKTVDLPSEKQTEENNSANR